MEKVIIFILAVFAVGFGIAALVNRLKLDAKETENKQNQTLVTLLQSLTKIGGSGPNLQLLSTLDVDALREISYQLSVYYQNNFLNQVIETKTIEDLYDYVKKINELPDSPQKDFIEEVLKEAIFLQSPQKISEIVYYIIKIKNTNGYPIGVTMKDFLFYDTAYLKFVIKDKAKSIVESIIAQKSIARENKTMDPMDRDMACVDFKDIIKKIESLTE